jgi:hypothetical protein
MSVLVGLLAAIAYISGTVGVDNDAEGPLANINDIPRCHRRGSTNQQDAASDSHSYARGEPHAPNPQTLMKKTFDEHTSGNLSPKATDRLVSWLIRQLPDKQRPSSSASQ